MNNNYLINNYLYFKKGKKRKKLVDYIQEIQDIIIFIGIKFSFFLAGFFGALTHFSENKKLSWIKKIIILISGGLIANYITPIIIYFFNLDDKLVLGVAFIVGHTGLKGVKFLLDYSKSKLKNYERKDQ